MHRSHLLVVSVFAAGLICAPMPAQNQNPNQPGNTPQQDVQEQNQRNQNQPGEPGRQTPTPAPDSTQTNTQNQTTTTTQATGAGGTLSGKLTGSQTDSVANAVVVVTDVTTGNSQRVVVGPDGSFTFNNLAPGSYRVEVEANGMKRAGNQTIQISSTGPAQIEMFFDDVNPPPGSDTGTVEIRGTAPTVQVDSAEISRAYGTRLVRSLPVLDRQHQELIGLMPGVTPPTINIDLVQNPQRIRTFNVNGQPDFANVQNQDGSYDNVGYTRDASRIIPNEAVQSLNVRTANYNAAYGFSGGSWANTVTRPGTNRVHGSAFGFNTNNFFTARHPLNNSGSDPRFNQNQFGGTVGAPIIKDRMFAFISYEAMLRRGRDLRIGTVPTQDFLAGNFSGAGATIYNPLSGNSAGQNRIPFPNNRIAPGQINPLAQALLPYFPAANLLGSTNNLVGQIPLLQDSHRIDGKIDHRFTDSTVGFFRYGFTHGSVNQGSLWGPLGDAARGELRNHNAVASVSHDFNNTFLGEFRFGYSRFRNELLPWTDFSNQSGALSNDLASRGLAGLPQINLNGFGTLGYSGLYPSKPVNNNFNASTNWMWHNGVHRLRFGIDAVSVRSSGFDPGFYSPLGSFTFGPGATALSAASGNPQFNIAANSFAAFLTGAPTQAGISSFNVTPNFTQNMWSGYVTDTLNLWQKVHLELGLRYDVFSRINPRNIGDTTNFNPFNNSVAPWNGDDTGVFNYEGADLNNIAPRIGVAIRPWERMVLRGAYSIQYFPVPFARAGLNFASTGVQTGVAGGFQTVPFQVPTVPSAMEGVAPNQGFYYTPGNQETPYVQTFNFMLQTDLTQGFLFDVGYTGAMGRQLPYSLALAAQPGTGLAGLPFADFNRTAQTTERGTGLNNNYHSLQMNLTKRFTGGLAFAGAYTWSKALDYGYDLMNPFDRAANYGLADWDRRHILAVSHVWNLPFGAGTPYLNTGFVGRVLGGWEINGILRWATGTPYTVMADPLACACPGVGAVNANISGTPSGNFNPDLFSQPSGSFGNLGRNALRGPNLFTYNTSLFKNFVMSDSLKLELRGEAYNLTNSSNLGNPVSMLGTPGFGQSLTTYNYMGGRQFQVGARLLF